MSPSSLLSLPNDLLVLLPEYFSRLEDAISLSQTCRKLRQCVESMSPKALLRLAIEPTNVLFRMSNEALLATVARQLGDWARISHANEARLVSQAQLGIEGLVELALQHCGLTLDRLWDYHRRRTEFLDPLGNIIDQCIGEQWYEPEYWDGGRDGASSVSMYPSSAVLHFALYGEIFGPDLESYISPADARARPLSLQTRLEIIKYCIPDTWIAYSLESSAPTPPALDPRLAIRCTGPYALNADDRFAGNHNLALVWTLQSPHWRRFWKDLRSQAGMAEIADSAIEPRCDGDPEQWRQELLESAMMLVPLADNWKERCREWREDVAGMQKPPKLIHVGQRATCDFPYLLGDLQVVGHPWLSDWYSRTSS